MQTCWHGELMFSRALSHWLLYAVSPLQSRLYTSSSHAQCLKLRAVLCCANSLLAVSLACLAPSCCAHCSMQPEDQRRCRMSWRAATRPAVPGVLRATLPAGWAALANWVLSLGRLLPAGTWPVQGGQWQPYCGHIMHIFAMHGAGCMSPCRCDQHFPWRWRGSQHGMWL